MTKKEKQIEDKFLNNILEINKLWEALGELIYMQSHIDSWSEVRNREAKRKFGEALIELRIIK